MHFYSRLALNGAEEWYYRPELKRLQDELLSCCERQIALLERIKITEAGLEEHAIVTTRVLAISDIQVGSNSAVYPDNLDQAHEGKLHPVHQEINKIWSLIGEEFPRPDVWMDPDGATASTSGNLIFTNRSKLP